MLYYTATVELMYHSEIIFRSLNLPLFVKLQFEFILTTSAHRPNQNPNVPACQNKNFQAKFLIFFKNICLIQTFINFLYHDNHQNIFPRSNEIGFAAENARDFTFYSFMNRVNSGISLFGKGCIFGAKIQTTKNYATVRLSTSQQGDPQQSS